MRKHHKRWVALFGAAAIVSSGLVWLPGAAADEKDAWVPNWPVVSQGVSSYSLDGYGIGYLPEGLEGHGINASSVTDRTGNRQSQISWLQGPDQLLAQVAVLRSERFQELDDLRSSRYGHLPEETLQRLDRNEALKHECYLSQETGDLFWLEEPGVAMAVHLRPDRWGSGELVRMAESLAPLASSSEKPAEEAAEEGTGGSAGEGASAEEPAAKEPGQDGPAAGEQATKTGSAQEPAEVPAAGASTVDKVADGTPADVAGTAPAGRPADPRPSDVPQVPEIPEVPETSGVPGAPAEQEEAPAEQGDQGEDVRVRQVKECVVGRFVNFETGETGVRQAGMTPSSAGFVERILTKDQLSAVELDRLLATVWYYGDEGEKTGAVSDCARDLSLTRTEVEEIVFGLSSLIAEIVQEAEQYEAGSTRTVEPIGAEEWQELWDSLPWSFPAGSL